MSNVHNYASLLVWGGSVFVSWRQERVPLSFLLLNRRRVCNSFDVNRLVHAHAQCRLYITSSTLQSFTCCPFAVMQYRNNFPLDYRLLGSDAVLIGTYMLMFRRNLLLEFVLRTGLNIRTFVRFFPTAFLPSFLPSFLPFSAPFFYSFLSFGFFCLHLYTFLMCLFISLFFTAIPLFLPCYVFPRFLSLSAHTSVNGSAYIVFLLSMYVSESAVFHSLTW